MGYKEITLKMATDFTSGTLKSKIKQDLKTPGFEFRILSQSLDARRKNRIHWLVRVGVSSPALPGGLPEPAPVLEIPRVKAGQRAVVTGSGPAGFFAALVLQTAGVRTTLLERGADVNKRAQAIAQFERSGQFDPLGNYAFGEGGAGTFSDGKLTSRSKHISQERAYVLAQYIRAGGPAEIAYLTYPHLGSDNLKVIVQNLRRSFEAAGGSVLFETLLEDLRISGETVQAAVSSRGVLEAEHFVLAPGHSALETYRMLIRRGVGLRTKNFALGCRVEHPQELINQAQWGRVALPGVKAAEYRLTTQVAALPVYTFCMCPGGMVVPATAYAHTNIVNGMSLYARQGPFANAACVAGVNPSALLAREVTAPEALDWLEALEEKFYRYTESYRAPCCSVADFISRRDSGGTPASSYPLGLTPAPLWELLPVQVAQALTTGLQDFCRKIRGFEQGTLLGLETKTSGILQALRVEHGRCAGFGNLYLAGEGSGYSGGIISSAADGIRCALQILAGLA